MSCDLIDDTYYNTSQRQVPVKWTAPEVFIESKTEVNKRFTLYRHYIIGSIQSTVTFGVMDVFCMKYGA